MATEKVEYNTTEHFKVVSQLNELAQTLRGYKLSDGAKEELTKHMTVMVTVLAFELAE